MYNFVHDLNKCIDNFQYVTHYFEQESPRDIYIEPIDHFMLIIAIYHKLDT